MAAKDKENAGERPRRSKLKIILIILFLIILLIGGAIAFWWFQLRQPGGLPCLPDDAGRFGVGAGGHKIYLHSKYCKY